MNWKLSTRGGACDYWLGDRVVRGKTSSGRLVFTCGTCGKRAPFAEVKDQLFHWLATHAACKGEE